MMGKGFAIFLVASMLAVWVLFIYWVIARQRFFKACDRYRELTGHKHELDFRRDR